MRSNGVSAEVERQMDAALKKLEELQGQKLGKGENRCWSACARARSFPCLA